jgi:hypothetical protein
MMPRDEYGVYTDIIFSPPGTTARANPGQLYETEYNFNSEIIRQRMARLPSVQEKLMLLVDYVATVNPKEGEHLRRYISELSEQGIRDLLEDTDKNGIYLVQPPFMNSISIKNLEAVYTKFKIAPGPVTIKQVFKNFITGLMIENNKLPVKKTDISLDSGKVKEIEYFDTASVKDIKGNSIGKVFPSDFDNGAERVLNKYFVVPDLKNEGAYYISYKGEIKQPGKAPDGKDAVKFNRVRAFRNGEGFLIREYQSQRPVVIGKKYIIVLKQNPDDKFSVRSLGSTNQVGIPNKPGKQTSLMSPYSKSSIRNGEMENDNFYIRIAPEIVHRYMATHSLNPKMIEAMAVMLATEDPLAFHDLPIRSEDIKDDAPALMLHATLFSMGIEIKPIYKERE